MKTRVYRTVSGDTWDLIAYKVYGNEKYFHRLIRNNLNLIDVSILPADIPVIIPDFIEELEQEIQESKLPPWKRGK